MVLVFGFLGVLRFRPYLAQPHIHVLRVPYAVVLTSDFSIVGLQDSSDLLARPLGHGVTVHVYGNACLGAYMAPSRASGFDGPLIRLRRNCFRFAIPAEASWAQAPFYTVKLLC